MRIHCIYIYALLLRFSICNKQKVIHWLYNVNFILRQNKNFCRITKSFVVYFLNSCINLLRHYQPLKKLCEYIFVPNICFKCIEKLLINNQMWDGEEGLGRKRKNRKPRPMAIPRHPLCVSLPQERRPTG